MATLRDIALQEPSTITARLAAVVIERNSTNQSQEVMVIGDPDSTTSSAIAKVINAPAASTAWGLVTRSARPNLVTLTSTAGSDTTVTLISSAATTPRILAYSVVSTVAGPIRAGFYAGSTLLWPVLLWADGGVPRDAQTGTLPGFLFTGQADRPVQFSVGTTGAFTVGLTYWAE